MSGAAKLTPSVVWWKRARKIQEGAAFSCVLRGSPSFFVRWQ